MNSTTTTSLLRADFDTLARSFIPKELAIEAGISRVDTIEGAEIVCRQPRASMDYSGTVIPYYWPGQTRPRAFRLRRDKPEYDRKPDGTVKVKNKYLSPPRSSNLFYIPKGTSVEWLSDVTIPAVFTEGEKKALALHNYYQQRGEKVLVIGLPGVWNWRGIIEVERDTLGHVFAEIKGAVPDFDRIEWKGRKVSIIFDSNVRTEPSVGVARRHLSVELDRRGSKVFWVDLPDVPGVNGVDDLLGIKGPDFVTEVIATATEFNPTFARTDMGNAERLVHQYGQRIRYSYNASEWFVNDGKRWRNDHPGKIEKLAKAITRSIYAEAAKIEDPDKRKELVAFAIKCENRMRVEAMLWLARSEVTREIEQFDVNPHLFNVANGTIDLQTGLIGRHDPNDYLSKIASVEFDERATCPQWLKFLDRIFEGKTELITFLQKAVGYTLSGDTSAQCLFVCYGLGANGKTVFLKTVSDLMGAYAMSTPIESLMVSRSDRGPREDIARLRGARLVVAAEAEDGQRFAESLIKQLTGGDTVTARHLYSKHFEFQPEFKLWLGVNHKPVIRGVDEGIWRRIRLIPFNVIIPEKERDPQLRAKLRTELSGILNWALQGFQLKEIEGFEPPEAVTAATKEYRIDMDSLGGFLADRCVQGNRYEVGATSLYNEFKSWANETNEFEMKQKAFGLQLKERGFLQGRDGMGRVTWRGLALKAEGKD